MDGLKDALKEYGNQKFWNRPLRLLVAAVIVAPLGGVFVSPFFAGRAAELYAQRTGRKHSNGLGIAFGVLWFALIFGPFYVWYFWFAGP